MGLFKWLNKRAEEARKEQQEHAKKICICGHYRWQHSWADFSTCCNMRCACARFIEEA